MRQILSISLPEDMVKKIKNKAKNNGFNSISAYFKYLFEMDSEDVISEKELMENVQEARKEYKAGKTIKANSIADLL